MPTTGETSHKRRYCPNCAGTHVAQYCADCGQKQSIRISAFPQLAGDFFGGLFNWDSRIWRTARPLLSRPGFLTIEYFSGRRVRYTPPVRLYLVLSLLFFVVTGWVFTPEFRATEPTEQTTGSVGVKNSGDHALEVSDPRDRSSSINTAFEHCSIGLPEAWSGGVVERRLARVCEGLAEPGAGQKILSSYIEKFPLLIMCLLPLIALASKVLYIGSERNYTEHLLVYVHYHAFVFALGILVLPLTAAARKFSFENFAGWIQYFALLYCAYYFFRMLRTVFGHGRVRTAFSFAMFTLVYLIGAVLLLVLGFFGTILEL